MDYEGYVKCVLEEKGYEILDEDAHGYDILAHYPHGAFYYYIEVKGGLHAKLSTTQRRFRERIELRPDAKYVVCRFDDDGHLVGDRLCKKLLSRYIP